VPNNTEVPPVTRVTLLARAICELSTEADARRFLIREALTLCGCVAAAFGRRGLSGALEFTFDGPPDLVESLTRVLAHTEEAVAAAAIELGEPVAVPDLVEEKRWSDYVSALVLHTPIRSVQAHQLRLVDVDHGVLVLYSTESGFFTGDRCHPGVLLADHAAIGLSLLENRHKAEHLTIALQNSREIGQAIGILMATLKVTSEKAFDLLRTASQHGHVKLREVAHEVTLTGQLPTTATPIADRPQRLTTSG
jgi:hypothetical protein